MLGSFCASTLSKYRVAPIPPSMLRVIVNHSPDSPARAGRGSRVAALSIRASTLFHTASPPAHPLL
jgi:hypothetical protein